MIAREPLCDLNGYSVHVVAAADANSVPQSFQGSSQIFFLLKESELTPSGANLLDGRYSVFGYITEGADLLNDANVSCDSCHLQCLRVTLPSHCVSPCPCGCLKLFCHLAIL